MLLAIDTETTGTDLHHGAKPYLITTCTCQGEQEYWEWDVDPLTREPVVIQSELNEFKSLLNYQSKSGKLIPNRRTKKSLVFHNAVFDIKALQTIDPTFENWDWEHTVDTLPASHLISSNTPHNLTALALQYLQVNVQPFEDRIKAATNKARAVAKKFLPHWKVAREGLSDMPSVKSAGGKKERGGEEESFWKADMWLPRAICKHHPELLPIEKDYDSSDPSSHSWNFLCRDYANSDTAVTVEIWKILKEILEDRKQIRIFEERLKLIPIVFKMQNNGMTLNFDRLVELKTDYIDCVRFSTDQLVEIAKNYSYDLEVPNGATNNSLKHFCFGYDPDFKGDGKTSCCLCGKKKLKTDRGMLNWYGPHHDLCSEKCSEDGKLYCSTKCYENKTTGKWLKLPAVAFSKKTGEPSVNKKATQIYAHILEDGTDQQKFISNLTVKRKLGKSLEYIGAYERFMRPVNSTKRRGHQQWYRLNPSLNPCGTDTLRWSSHNPSQQVISKQLDHNGRNLRYIFGPEEGREWYSLDYDNLELRIPAYECQEPAMLELFENPDKAPYFGSYHLLIFSILHPDKYDHDDPQGLNIAKKKYASTYYGWTKNGNFADMYGAVDTGDGAGTADLAYHVPGAQSIISKKLTQKAALNRYWIDFAKKHGYVETMPDRTIGEQGYPLQCKRGKWGNVLETVPLNYHVQGTACWVVMRAMIKVQAMLDQWNNDCGEIRYKMIMNVHDEIVLDFPKPTGKSNTNLPKVRAVRRAMESIGEDIGVKLTCGLDCHTDNWSKSLSL